MIRLERILDETDRRQIGEQLLTYLQTGSDKYVYGLKSSELPRELEKLGKEYYTVYSGINEEEKYQNKKEFINFSRVYKEHFVVVNHQISPKPTVELNGGMLQSPDNQDATYRKKKEQHCKGYTINGTETANPDNPLQLVTDIAVNPNNIDDSQIIKNKGRYYFTHEDYLQNRRNRNIINIPGERRKIRPNVEALMREFKARAPGGKTRVRGLFKTSLFEFNAGIAINFGRIFRYIVENGLINGAFSSNASIFYKTLQNIHQIFLKTYVFASNFRIFLFYTKYFSNKPITRPLNFISF